ncbi:MAG TPA: outer membrane protein assembly factor BamD [Anaeromyxobacter sp.]|nr:outer membrane protein assembly factor BamD [Anaeromyxobacter sp.]
MGRILPILLLAAGLAACATKHTSISGALKLAPTPEENYQYGMDELKAHNYGEATRFFEYVRAKYPFSKVSIEADLRLCDIRYDQGRYLDAAAAYEKFLQDHPSSDALDYAHYRAGVSHFRAAPGDFFLFPNSYEKDEREMDKAVSTLREFVKSRPGSQYLADAKKTLARAEAMIAHREMYAGDFYAQRGYWAGAAGRYRGLTENYPDTPLAEPAAIKLAQAYLQLKESHLARQALQRFIVEHPESGQRHAAEKLLESLR